MTPWDVKALGKRLETKGLTAGEEVLRIFANELLDWAVESCMLSENTMLKFLAPIIMGVKPTIMAEIDKVDGKKA